jgi:hypothetical protein
MKFQKISEFITAEIKRFINGEKLLGEILLEDYDFLA